MLPLPGKPSVDTKPQGAARASKGDPTHLPHLKGQQKRGGRAPSTAEVAEGCPEEQELIAVVCPASGFECPPGTVAAIQVVPLSGQKCWGGMGQKGRGQFQVCSAFLVLFLLPLWQFKMTRGGCEGKGGSFSCPPM